MKKHLIILLLLTAYNLCSASNFIVSDEEYYVCKSKDCIGLDMPYNYYDSIGTEIDTINSDFEIIYRAPIYIDSVSRKKITVDNKLLLYNVPNLGLLITTYGIENNIISIDTIVGTPSIYVLSLKMLSYSQIDSLCNVMAAGPYCQFAEPNEVYLTPVTQTLADENPKFKHQWHLYDKKYNSLYDINALEAWNYSVGEDITVAIIDVGCDLNHEDLVDNFLLGYDCTNSLDGARNGAYKLIEDYHGTLVAGIIGGVNNDKGIIGVAPSCKIISIRALRHQQTIIGTQFKCKTNWIIKALRKANEVGADIINNSWNLIEYGISKRQKNILKAELENLTKRGRNGLGTIVVFAAGNENLSKVNYPANQPNMIVVGATTSSGYRWEFSNYKEGLDLVAPGEDIYTTTIESDYMYDSGTSLSCPIVSGVAALILSANPLLRRDSVENILKQTANKLSNYDFSMEQYPLIGSWNNEVGHGLVDAYAALVEVNKKYIQNVTYSSEEIENELGSFVYIGDSVTNRKAPGDVILNEGGNLMVQATKEIRFTDGFHARAGSNMIAQIVPESEWKNLSSARRSSIRSNAPKNNSHSNIEEEGSVSQNFDNGLECTSATITCTNVYSLSGFLLQTFEGENYTLSYLPSGMYILQHRMSDGSTRSEKIANNK